VRVEGHGSGKAAGSYIRQSRLQQAFEFQKVFGAKTERHFAAVGAHAADARQRRTQESQRESDWPGFVGRQVRQFAAGEFQVVGKLLFDRAIQGQREGLVGRRLRCQRMQGKVMALVVDTRVLYFQIFQRNALDIEERERLVRAYR